MMSNPSAATTARAELVERTVTAWLENFGIPISDQLSQQDFLATYHPQIEWYDHAFHIRRVGHEAVLGLKKAFLHCNQPWRTDLKALHLIEGGAVVEQMWVGCCKNDIVRPNGELVVKGTGKDFKAQVCMVLKIDDDGLVTRIDKYYNRAWDEGVQETEYVVMKGGSLKV